MKRLGCVVKAGTILFHGTYSDQIIIDGTRNVLYFGHDDIRPSVAIITEKQHLGDNGKIFMYEAIRDIEALHIVSGKDMYFLRKCSDTTLLSRGFIAENDVAAIGTCDEAKIYFKNHDDFTSKLRLIKVISIDTNSLYGFIGSLELPECFSTTIYPDDTPDTIILKTKTYMCKTRNCKKIEKFIEHQII
jgi:hypothetical protein